MREIKFRGFGKDKKQWIYGSLLDERSVRIVAIQDDACHVWEVEPESVGEFTGVCNFEGRAIYEGDILRKRDYLPWRTHDTGVVFWHPGECRWCVNMSDGLVFSLTSRKTWSWKVIGNMHDNAEFLTEVANAENKT